MTLISYFVSSNLSSRSGLSQLYFVVSQRYPGVLAVEPCDRGVLFGDWFRHASQCFRAPVVFPGGIAALHSLFILLWYFDKHYV